MALNDTNMISRSILGPMSLARIRRPIFIIAPPRSGSTFLFDCLAQFDETFHVVGRECEYIWWQIFPYSNKADLNDELRPEDATRENIRMMRRLFYEQAVQFYTKKKNQNDHLFPYFLGIKSIRYLDKTISNCFHLDFIKQAFRDAHYVLLVRDPRENVSSMMEGWPEVSRFGKKALTDTVGRLNGTIEHWTYPAPLGWQNVVHEPLQNICAWSWCRHIEAALSGLEGEQHRVTQIRYETLRDNPQTVVGELAKILNLRMTGKVESFLQLAPNSRTTVSAPKIGKWHELHGEEIDSILPIVRELARKIGYDV